jgi:hypothetical protein
MACCEIWKIQYTFELEQRRLTLSRGTLNEVYLATL